MLRSGFLLGLVGPAAVAAFLLLPAVRASADRLTVPGNAASDVAFPVLSYEMPDLRPSLLEISPVKNFPLHYATMPPSEPRLAPTPAKVGPTASEKEEPVRPRRLTREGCETPLSSLVGPEARRMVPGRCMT